MDTRGQVRVISAWSTSERDRNERRKPKKALGTMEVLQRCTKITPNVPLTPVRAIMNHQTKQKETNPPKEIAQAISPAIA